MFHGRIGANKTPSGSEDPRIHVLRSPEGSVRVRAYVCRYKPMMSHVSGTRAGFVQGVREKTACVASLIECVGKAAAAPKTSSVRADFAFTQRWHQDSVEEGNG